MVREAIGRDGSVSLHYVDLSAAAGELLRDEVACHGSAREQDALAGEVVRGEGFEQTFGDVLLTHEVDFEMEGLDGVAGGRADGADARAELAQVGGGAIEGLHEKPDSVGAGED